MYDIINHQQRIKGFGAEYAGKETSYFAAAARLEENESSSSKSRTLFRG